MPTATLDQHVVDPARLSALTVLDILDTPVEAGFEDVVRLAARLCAVPVALVSLVSANRQWFKARIGFPPCETDLDRSVCKFALAEPDLLVIPDLSLDPRTAANPLVTGEPRIRFYAGAPLRLSQGQTVGSLCVIDTVPRPGGLTAEQADDLRTLGRQVVALLEARRVASEARAGVVREREAQVRTLAQAKVSEAQNVSLRRSQAVAQENIDRVQLALDAGAIIGTWNWHLPTDRFTVDAAFARSFGLDPALGRDGIPLAQIVATVHPDDQAELAAAIADAVGRGGAYAHQYRVRRADGRYYWIEANGRVDLAPDGTPVSFPGVLLDVEERRATQEALRVREAHWRALSELGDRLRDLDSVPALVHAAAEILARTTGATRAGYGLVDAARETVEVLTDWCAPGIATIAGLHSFRTYGSYIEDLKRGEIVEIEDVSHDPRTCHDAGALLAIGVRVLLNVPIVERGRLVGIGFVNYAAAHTFNAEEQAFVRAVADRVQTAVARVNAEAQQRLLNEEISHRLKNSFAMVLSISGQTLRSVPERGPVEAFEQRIHALSSAHDVLLRKSWAAAPVRDVVQAVLAGAGHGDRVQVSGPEIDLGPRATLSLSLLLHELTTNAAKYGALSVPSGRVVIDWRLDGADENREVAFDWAEQDGPPVVPPAQRGRRGFGSRLIGMGLAGAGGVELRYLPTGFQATMRAPLIQLQNS